MPTSFMSLPRELRQRILLLTLPHVIKPAIVPYLSLPARAILHVNHTIRQDMCWVLNNYSPHFYFNTPSDLSHLLSSLTQRSSDAFFDYKPKFEHVAFSIFHDAKVDTMHWTCYCLGRHMHSHDELFNAWAAAVPFLPNQVTTITLDITPAPGWMREDRPDWIRTFIQDRRVAKIFVPAHEDITLLLIQSIHQHFGDGVTVQLSGHISEKNRSSIDAIIARTTAVGLNISFVGSVLAVQHTTPKPPISDAVRKLAPLRYGWIEEESRYGCLAPRNEKERKCARLRDVGWSADTEKLWLRISTQNAAWAIDLLVRFGNFMTNDEVDSWDCEPMDNRKRALVHNMAKDLGCTTQSFKDEPERFVRIEKNGQKL
jgi:hypothetical protein